LAPEANRHLRWSARNWTALRKSLQAFALLAFVALFVLTRRVAWPPSLVNLPLRLDPLAMLAHLLASRTFLVGSALALLTLLLTLAAGRVWCGWLCPLGTVLDLFSLGRWRAVRSAPAAWWRKAKYGLLLTTVSAALFTNLTLLVFDPLTILFRTLSASVWPALDQVVTAAEAAFYRVPALQPAVLAFERLARPRLLPV
jgi:polyferredoxin